MMRGSYPNELFMEREGFQTGLPTQTFDFRAQFKQLFHSWIAKALARSCRKLIQNRFILGE